MICDTLRNIFQSVCTYSVVYVYCYTVIRVSELKDYVTFAADLQLLVYVEIKKKET